ncbi:MAG TPA: choice-of-anchor J domain-containing protein [Ignavibacteria bacterium]|nr:choice-of-anchor J domain-containing protein [Ignavibacteria bacterium]HQY52995.1 choice-of-anchor J domain-containing protein [Ignavibacteria bacterium]HRB00096.1 choice-of-anchor J domain-containing protein [Ignavibacteria bacterium]
MKKIYAILFIIFFTAGVSTSQVIWNQGFESSDSANVPPGWSVWNNSPADTLEPGWNWTVRPAGLNVPGLGTSLSVVHTGDKAIGVSWWTGQTSGICDAWLVTQKVNNVPSDALLSFWVSGGSATFSDSVSVWVSTGDSTPASFLATPKGFRNQFFYPVGSTYGLFEQQFVDLAPFAGQNIYIAFRYNMDVAVNGYFVYLDDIELTGTVGITQNGTSIPAKFSLNQNYPNPFNPSTKISFDLAKSSNVNLVIFNSLGQKVMDVFQGQKPAGSYTATFDGSSLSSGTYFYRLETESFTQTKKMQLIK